MPGNPLVPRLQGLGTTIFAEMSALALETGSINLGQGFPDVDGPDVIKQAAVDAIWAGRNQYPPGIGVRNCVLRSPNISAGSTTSSSIPTPKYW